MVFLWFSYGFAMVLPWFSHWPKTFQTASTRSDPTTAPGTAAAAPEKSAAAKVQSLGNQKREDFTEKNVGFNGIYPLVMSK